MLALHKFWHFIRFNQPFEAGSVVSEFSNKVSETGGRMRERHAGKPVLILWCPCPMAACQRQSATMTLLVSMTVGKP
jgi:hypothetical protein